MNRILWLGSRTMLAGALAAAAALVWLQREAYRGVEAAVAGWTSALVTGSHDFVNAGRATYFVNVGTPKVFGVVVTPECSSAIVTAVILVASLVALSVGRLSVLRVLAAMATAIAFFAAVNIVRLTFITYSSDQWGLDGGYRFSHIWAGTAITTFGGALTVVAFLLVLSGRGFALRGRGTHRTESQR